MQRGAPFTAVFQAFLNGTHAAGLTGISVLISKDGGEFAPASGAVSEVGHGWYKIPLTGEEMNAEVVVLEISHAEATIPGVVLMTDTSPTITAAAVWENESRTLTGFTPSRSEDLTPNVYCTRFDVERRWGGVNVQKWADIDSDRNPDKITAQINWAIEYASSRIDADFASYIYKLPFNPIPSEVRKHAAALAGVELFHSRSMAATNDSPTIQRAENEYTEWKTMIFSGVEIPGAEKRTNH